MSAAGGNCGFAPETIALTGSENVFINGVGAVRQGDLIAPHSCFNCGSECDSTCPPHTGVYVGAHTVIINGRSAQTVGDPVSCTCIAITGSPNVIIN